CRRTVPCTPDASAHPRLDVHAPTQGRWGVARALRARPSPGPVTAERSLPSLMRSRARERMCAHPYRALTVPAPAHDAEGSAPDTLPDIPTVGEFIHGYEASAWYGIGAPRNTPAATCVGALGLYLDQGAHRLLKKIGEASSPT